MGFEQILVQYTYEITDEPPVPMQPGGFLFPDYVQLVVRFGQLEMVTVIGNVVGDEWLRRDVKFVPETVHLAPEWLKRLLVESRVKIVQP